MSNPRNHASIGQVNCISGVVVPAISCIMPWSISFGMCRIRKGPAVTTTSLREESTVTRRVGVVSAAVARTAGRNRERAAISMVPFRRIDGG